MLVKAPSFFERQEILKAEDIKKKELEHRNNWEGENVKIKTKVKTALVRGLEALPCVEWQVFCVRPELACCVVIQIKKFSPEDSRQTPTRPPKLQFFFCLFKIFLRLK